MKKIPLLFLGAWTFFLLNGLLHAFLLPPWKGFDEWLHYSYVAYLARTGHPPLLNALSIPQEVSESVEDGGKGTQVNDFRSPFVQTNWQAQHPPLFYFLLSPVYKFSTDRSVVQTLWIFRIFSLLLASSALIPIYLLFRHFFDAGDSLFGLVLLSAYPSTFVLLGHMTNDCLAFPIFMALILWCVKHLSGDLTARQSMLGGAIFGIGLLTKLYILTAVVPVLFLFLYRFSNEKNLNPAKSLLIFSAAAMAISCPWLLHNYAAYGTWNSTIHSTLSKDLGFLDKLHWARAVDWKSFMISNFIGLLWAGDWGFLSYPPVVYKLFALFCLLLTAGVGALLWKNKNSENFPKLVLLILFSLSFLAGLMRHQIDIRSAGNLDSTGAWYWTVLLPTHILLLMLCFKQFLSRQFAAVKIILLLSCLILSAAAAGKMITSLI